MIGALKLRPGETVKVASAAILGAGKDMQKTLERMAAHDAVLVVVDSDQTIHLANEAFMLPSRAKNEINRWRTQAANQASAAKAGRKRKTTPEQDTSILRMAKTHTINEIAESTGLEYLTVWRRLNEKERDR